MPPKVFQKLIVSEITIHLPCLGVIGVPLSLASQPGVDAVKNAARWKIIGDSGRAFTKPGTEFDEDLALFGPASQPQKFLVIHPFTQFLRVSDKDAAVALPQDGVVTGHQFMAAWPVAEGDIA